MKRLWVIGSGGHAKVVIDTARATGRYEVIGCLDDDPARVGATVLGVPVVAAVSARVISGLGVEAAIIAIGSNAARKAIAQRLDGRISWGSLVHPAAVVSESALLGPGTVVFAGAIVQPDSAVGDHAVLNTGCTVDHDAQIADYVHIGPGVHLAGHVQVGEGALLGVGVSVIPGIEIGSWSTVGAGASVIADVPRGATVVGVPARSIA